MAPRNLTEQQGPGHHPLEVERLIPIEISVDHPRIRVSSVETTRTKHGKTTIEIILAERL